MTFGQTQTWERVRDVPVEHADRYHLEVPFELPEPVTYAHVLAALRQLQERHEVLRTQFDTSEPFSGTQHLVEVDPSEVTELQDADVVGRPWNVDMRSGTMPWACRMTGDKTRVQRGTIGLHHAIGDMTTARILARDLYDFLAGKTQRERPPQPRDLAIWQRRAKNMAASQDYWSNLMDRRPRSDLFSRTEVARRDYWYTSVPIGKTTTVRPSEASALGLASLMCTLSLMLEEENPAIGLDFSNRWHRGTTDLVDCVIQMLPVSIALSESMTGAEVLKAVNKELASAMSASMFDQTLPGTGIDVDYSLGLVGTIGFNFTGFVPRHVYGFDPRILRLSDTAEPQIEEIIEWNSRHMMVSLAEESGIWVASVQASKELMAESDIRCLIRHLRSVFGGGSDFLATRVGAVWERAMTSSKETIKRVENK